MRERRRRARSGAGRPAVKPHAEGPPAGKPLRRESARSGESAAALRSWGIIVVGLLVVVAFGGGLWYGRAKPPEPGNSPTAAPVDASGHGTSKAPAITPKTSTEDTVPGAKVGAPGGALKGHNVVLISMDTTRADHVGCYGYEYVRTPALDRLAAEGVRCATAITPSPSTLPAHCSLHTGLDPHHHGARANGTFRLEEDVTTLAERLRDSGYKTGAVVSAFVLDSRFGLSQGFDSYDDDLSKGIKYSPHMFRERPAELTNEHAIAWLRENAGEKFFLWIHYFDPHAVYLPPEPYRTEYAGHLYDGEIAYVDTNIGAFMSELHNLGIADKTLTVVTSDHGEGLGDHGEQTHSLLLYDSTLHVPLIFHSPPHLPGGHVIEREVSLIDVMPTVLALLGEPVPDGVDGLDLCKGIPAGSRSAYIETIATMTLHGWAPLLGVREDLYKYVFAPTRELYDLVNDPGELLNIHDDRRDTAVELDARLAEMLGDDPFLATRGIAPNLTPDDESRRHLAALGYVQTISDEMEAQLSLDPKDMVYHWEELQRGINLNAAGKAKEALPILEKCVEDVEGDIFARQVLAGIYQMRGDHEKLIEFVKRSIELEPHNEGLWLSLAAAHTARGELEEAEQAIERALEIEPQCAQAFIHRGRIALFQKDEELALRMFEKAMEMDPGTTGPAALDAMGFLHLRARRLGMAREAFESAIKIDALNGAARDGLANVLIEEGNVEEAERELWTALRFDPNQPRVLASLCSLMIERDELGNGIEYCQRALDLSPNFPQARSNIGLAYRRQDKLDLAEENYKVAIENGRFFDAAYVNLAQLYVMQGKKEDGMRNFELALRANPYNTIALANLGANHFNEGRMDKALKFYRRALFIKPDYALVHRNIASLYLYMDNPHKVAFHLERTLELDPDQEDADELRVALEGARREAESRPPPEEEPEDDEPLDLGDDAAQPDRDEQSAHDARESQEVEE